MLIGQNPDESELSLASPTGSEGLDTSGAAAMPAPGLFISIFGNRSPSSRDSSVPSIGLPIVYRDSPVQPPPWYVKALATAATASTAAITAIAAVEFVRNGQDLMAWTGMSEEHAESTATGVMSAAGALTLAQAIAWSCYWAWTRNRSDARVAPAPPKPATEGYGTFAAPAASAWTTVPLNSPPNSDDLAPA